MLVAENITKSYSGRQALADISLSVKRGDIVAIIGPSGGGKSTLLRALALLDPPDAGRVAVDDLTYQFPTQSVHSPPSPWPRVTLVFQQLFLWPHLTIRQNLELPLRRLDRTTSRARVEQAVGRLGLDEFLDRHPNEVSIGQRQKAAIARATVLNPSYLLLDEITSALDVENIKTVLDHLLELARAGTGILLVTHLIGFAKSATNQVLFVEDGRIVERGSSDVLGDPKSKRLAGFLSLIDISESKTSKNGSSADFLQLRYTADAVLARIRQGNLPNPQEALFLDSMPLVDALRKAVRDDDVRWLTDVLCGKEEKLAGLACSLLKRFKGSPNAVGAFEKAWPKASPYLKNRILWRLADERETAEKWHQQLLFFILSEWVNFRDFNLTFYGEVENALRNILARLADENEPEHKKWLYLCSLPEVVDDPKVVRELLNTCRNLPFPHMSEVATALLEKFWPAPESTGPRRARLQREITSATFVVDSLMCSLRQGQRPLAAEARSLTSAPVIGHLQAAATSEDLRWLIPGLQGLDEELICLHLSLLRRFIQAPEVLDGFRDTWRRGSGGVKAHAASVLAFSAFKGTEDESWAEELMESVVQNWNDFKQAVARETGNGNGGVLPMPKRQGDASDEAGCPWLNLCVLVANASSPTSVGRVLQDAAQSTDRITRQLVARLTQTIG